MPCPTPADPRCYATSADDPYVAIAEEWLPASSASQREAVSPALVRRYRGAMEQARDAEILRSLRRATSPEVYRCLASALDAAVHDADPDAGVALRLFAIPLLVVTGGRAGAEVPGVVPDIARVQRVLQDYSALGRIDNFGLGNALCEANALGALPPSRLHALTRGRMADGIEALHLPPVSIRTAAPDEAVHLRFLTGAAVVPADAPSFRETGSTIARWGLPLTQELAAQLKVPDLSVLPIPRPPASLIAALATGQIAREELDLQAFVSRALRRLRSAVGEPEAVIAALESERSGLECNREDCEQQHSDSNGKYLALRFTSPFAADRVEVHRRSLHPGEDLSAVVADLLALLEACRVRSVAVLPDLQHAEAFTAAPAALASA